MMRWRRSWRHPQLAVGLRAAEAGQVVEEVGDVGGDVGPAREQAGVGVQPRRARVVVAGADADVAADAAVLAAHDERALGVRLERGEAVHDVHAGALERACPADVARLVERALSSTSTTACLPCSAARMSAGTIGESPEVR